MPPRRPLPDLDLITVFKMLTPNDQMVAMEMSPRCAVLVRAANRTVKTLLITPLDVAWGTSTFKEQINSFSLASIPAMQPLMDISAGEPSYPHYPMTTTRFNKWNVLQLDPLGLQLTTPMVIEQITTVFSAVTDLKFITVFGESCEHLVALLRHPNWQRQLTHLMVIGLCGMDSRPIRELVTTAINGLTALQQLALDGYSRTAPLDLPILAQLKVVAFDSDNSSGFLRSLEQHAADNAHLQVHLFSFDTEALFSLSQPLHSRIVRLGFDESTLVLSDATRLCNQFRFLTSLNVASIPLAEPVVVQLFTVLSQLPQLVYLNMGVYRRREEREVPPKPLPPLPPRPRAQMNSLRALELHLSIDSHSEIEWLNLPVTMPNLQSIYISMFHCRSCGVLIDRFDETEPQPLLNSSEALNCFHSSLFTLHPGVSMKRFILNSYEESTSAEKLLLQSQ